MSDGRINRARLLEGALLAGGGAAAGAALLGWLPDQAASRASAKRDAEILNFALLIEYVQAGLYAEALERGRLRGELREFAETVGGHEREHVDFVRGALGGGARKAPTLDFGEAASDPSRFTRAAIELEDLGLAAYNTQAVNLTRDALRSVARIVSVEARHAAWVRDLAGENPAPDASDPQVSARRVVQTLDRLGYVK